MHLCRGNCLSQVLPGTFIVSPDTEYSLPSPDLGGGAVIVFAAPASSRKGEEAEQGKETLVCEGATEAWTLDFPLQQIPLRHTWEEGSGAKGQVLVLNP